jgi:hypothetical protein
LSFPEILEMAIEMAKEKGSVVRVWFGNKLGVALMDPRDVEVTELFFFPCEK